MASSSPEARGVRLWQAYTFPWALRDRLGPDATASLLERLDESQTGGSDEVLTARVERLERRLIEEVSSRRLELPNALARFGKKWRADASSTSSGRSRSGSVNSPP
jgi:hypothetical protein